MAFSFNDVGGKGEGDTISIPFPYIHRDHIFVRVDGEPVSKTLYEFTSGSTITCLAGFPEGTTTRVERVTPPDELPSAQQGNGVFDWRGANNNDLHLLYIAQERADLEEAVIESASQVASDLSQSIALSNQLLDASDAAVSAAETATTKAAEAADSASTATTKASTATTKAAEAADSASTATTKASEAADSASTATTKASEAATSASAAADALATLDQSNMAITGGTIDGVTIGGTTPIPSAVITDLEVSSINGGPLAGLRNRIINGNFNINQRAKSGTVTLTANQFGHDRWRAGAGGCTYTFATSGGVTTLTITAGSLCQTIKGTNLQTDAYTLSWAGTCQGKIGSEDFADSGVTTSTTSTTGGLNLTVEFGTGTLALVQVEAGDVVTPFEWRPKVLEKYLCMGYAEKSYNEAVAPATATANGSMLAVTNGTSRYRANIEYRVPKEAPATLILYSPYDGASAKAYNASTTTNLNLSVLTSGEVGAAVEGYDTVAEGDRITFQWFVEAEILS